MTKRELEQRVIRAAMRLANELGENRYIICFHNVRDKTALSFTKVCAALADYERKRKRK